MEYSPPPLFKQGPSAIARLIFFVTLALALLVSDARLRTLEKVREAIGTGLYPLQRAALVPRDAASSVLDFLTSGHQLRAENAELQARNLKLSLQQSQAIELEAENQHLRALLDLAQRPGIKSIPAEVQYDTRDPFTQKVVIDHGSSAGVQLGAPVVDESGVLGQVTRVFPLQSEVTLLTDKDQAVPVQLVRTGLRSVIYGTPRGEALDLRFVPSSADIKIGDMLVTSGLDGVFPAGLPVARIAQIDRQADTAFAHVICTPIAPIHGPRQLLVLLYQTPMPPSPIDLDGTATIDKDKDGVKGGAKKTMKSPEHAPSSGAASASVSSPAVAAPVAATAHPAAPGGVHNSGREAHPSTTGSAAANPASPAAPAAHGAHP